MREIKFRAWNDKAKKMYYDVDLVNSQWLIEGHYLIYSDKDDIMQYTGLKDKNGKEIYEGDILDVLLNSMLRLHLKVKFSDGSYWVVGKDYESRRYAYRITEVLHEAEVIGNIYENKYLINGDK